MRAGLLIFLPLLVSPTAFPFGTCDAHRAPPSGHIAADVLSDFGAAELQNAVVGPEGMVELARSDAYRGQDETSLGIGENNLYGPVAARNSQGQFIVGWVESTAAWFQMYDVDWGPKGGPVPLSPYPGRISQLAIGVGPDDRFAVVWSQFIGPGANDYDLYLQCFRPDGGRIGSAYDVTANPSYQGMPAVAVNSKGLIVVAWEDERLGSRDILAQFLDFDGATIGHIISVCKAPGDQVHPRLALFSDDDFIVAWGDSRDSGAGSAVYARLVGFNGTELGTEFRVSQASWDQDYPSVVVDPGEGFIVGWLASQTRGSGNISHYARSYDSALRPTTTQLAAGTVSDSGGPRVRPDLLVAPNGGFIMAWDERVNNTPGAIRAQQFDAAGNSVGSEMVASAGLTGQSCGNIFRGGGANISFLWNAGFGFHIRQFVHPLFSSGTVTVESTPRHLWNWTEVHASIENNSLAGELTSLKFSVDMGATWTPVPGNGSLWAAGNAPSLRLMVTLTTYDPQTGPKLRSLTVQYVVNSLPRVVLPPEVCLSRTSQVNVTAAFWDDDGDPLDFLWTQTGGPSAVIFESTVPWLSFRSNVPGTYNFRFLGNDGFGDGNAACLNVTLLKTGPQARLGAAPAVLQVFQPVLLDASNSTGPESPVTIFSFDFGDGNGTGWQSESSVSTSYARSGQYFATVRVHDREGTEAKSAPVPVTVLAKPNQTDGTPFEIPPVCAILCPADGERVWGRIVVSGSAENGSQKLTAVEIMVDGADWHNVSGLRSWRFGIDTWRLGNGEHVVEARAFDGKSHSEKSSIRFVVANPTQEPSVGDTGVCASGLVAVVVVGAATMLFLGRRNRGFGLYKGAGPFNKDAEQHQDLTGD